MNEEDKIQLMDDYLSGRLSRDESEALERQLNNDPEMAKDLQLQKDIRKGIELDNTLAGLRTHLNSLRDVSPGVDSTSEVILPAANGVRPQRTPRVMLWRWVSGVAAILLISVGAYLYLPSDSGQALYTEFYQPYRGSVQLSILRGDSALGLEQKAIQAYDSRNYREAANLIEKVIEKNPEDGTWPFYLGIAYMELNDLSRAQANLGKVAANPQSLLYRQARWYLALSFLKNHQREQAKKILQGLQGEGGVYEEKARLLYDRL